MSWNWGRKKYVRRTSPAAKPSKLSIQVRNVMRDIGLDPPENMQIERLFTSANQRSMGAWLWSAFNADDTRSIWEIGSCSPATEIVSAHKSKEWTVESYCGPGGVELLIERAK